MKLLKKLVVINLMVVLLAIPVLFTSLNITYAVQATSTEEDAVRSSTSNVLEDLENKQPASGLDIEVKEEQQSDKKEENKKILKSRKIMSNVLKASSNGITWNISDDVLTISGNGKMDDYTSSNLASWNSQAKTIKSIAISDGITYIGKLSFYGCSNVETISIPDSVTGIGEAAFYNCNKLNNVVLPSKITKIEKAVFADCKNLSSLTAIGVTEIEEYAFQETAFTEFNINKNITNISKSAFWDTNIEKFTGGSSKFQVKDGVVYTDDYKTLFVYPQGNKNTSFAIPNTVIKVGEHAFANNKYLEQITIANTVKELAESSFQQCNKLQSIIIPDSVTSTGNFTFYGCKNLKSVIFGKGLKTTSYQMFRNCYSLENIDFGTNLQTLYAHTFAYCSALKAVTIPANIKEIGNGAFGCCSNLETVVTKGLSNVGYQTFLSCNNLTSVTLNEGVKNIHRCAFDYCTNLKTITLPKSTKYVHSYAFPKETIVTCKDTNMRRYGVNGYRYLQDVSISGERKYDYAFEVLKLVNQERKKEGLSELKMDQSLLETAMVRATENATCFSHTRPDSSICFDLSDKMIAENIAVGQSTAKSVMNSWMNSQGHKANILLKNATTIGIGCFVNNGIFYWSQNFGMGDNSSNCAQPKNQNKTQIISIATEKFKEAEQGKGVIFSTGNSQEYLYKFRLVLDKTSINGGDTTSAKLYLQNAGWSGATALLNNNGISWSSSSIKNATVDNNGKIRGVQKGSSTITAKLKYYNASAKITINKLCQNISYKNEFNKTYGDKKFKLNAKLETGNGKITYSSSNKKVAKVDGNGKVTIKGTGCCTITVKASGTSKYAEKIVKINIKVKPKRMGKTTLKVPKTKQLKVKWKKDSQASGYQIRYSTSKKFTNKTTKKVKITKKSTLSKTIKKLKKGKKYYVQIRAYKTVTVDGKSQKLYGDWSKTSNIKVK